jgi:hypothetical protein
LYCHLCVVSMLMPHGVTGGRAYSRSIFEFFFDQNIEVIFGFKTHLNVNMNTDINSFP